MIKTITVDSKLAEAVNKELHSIKPPWQFVRTTNFYYQYASPEQQAMLDNINRKYGPVVDTQRFTDEIFNRFSRPNARFIDIRTNPNSRYNKNYPNTAKLVNYLQMNYIPENYSVYRLMSNMQTIRPKWLMNAIHPDASETEKNFITILYYVNNSDGDTFFFEGDECISRMKPIKGTAAIYPSKTWHAGSTPIEHETRVVINMVFGPNK